MIHKKHLLDANLISKLCYPQHPSNQKIVRWFLDFINQYGSEIYLPEIVSYEVRRGLCEKKLRDGSYKGFDRFEKLSKHLTYLPINTSVFRIAENLWATARVNGYTTASKESLDADVLLAAQAIEIEASVITENTKHLKRYVTAFHWEDLLMS
jgi:predicted nucleic acid-binding protein